MIEIIREITVPKESSFFLFGPRGTGKTRWLKERFPESLYLDLLSHDLQFQLSARPGSLEFMIPKELEKSGQLIILDEVQKIPALLDEVHRLIESKKLRFALTGSSARKLRSSGANLLAGRAITCQMHPFSSLELGERFSVEKALTTGLLPKAYLSTPDESQAYLRSYVGTYLKEEVQQEALVRNLEGFSRFLQTASFSQASLLNRNRVAQDASLGRKATEGYFEILQDLLLAFELPVFSLRAKRDLVKHNKFYYFDCGVFQSLRPRGPLDTRAEMMGAAFETLILQDLRAINASQGWNAVIYFWRTRNKKEVDFVIYGEDLFCAIEVKGSSRLRSEDFDSLSLFGEDYPQAAKKIIYLGEKSYHHSGIDVIAAQDWFQMPATKRVSR